MNTSNKLTFYKYQGTGNDFILLDDRNEKFPKGDTELIKLLCDRRFGIGADGLILLQNEEHSDFKMVYFNADGNESTMCGNGGRCIVAFAHSLGLIEQNTIFTAVDGNHHAMIDGDKVSLQMIPIKEIIDKKKYYFLNTGSPHHVQIVTELEQMDVAKDGARLRYGIYGEAGSNINFVEQETDNVFAVRTYERGVEGETLSCGTGVTAVALAMHKSGQTKNKEVAIKTKGGTLKVTFDYSDGVYNSIWLIGEAKLVYKGELEH
ncbi:diaminopimelate epimerase [uncultured Croceitalea sp.]|uniref:diaminopimelate epimerase n=1 Tax=uncultured Croceitalea sp. TaxID=1798908 RepID=UPI0033055EFB